MIVIWAIITNSSRLAVGTVGGIANNYLIYRHN